MQVLSAPRLRSAVVLFVLVPGCGWLEDCNPLLNDDEPATGGATDSGTDSEPTDPTVSPKMCKDENGICELGEDYKTCPQDCMGDGASCGNNVCDKEADLESCPDECCGDGDCNQDLEDMDVCPEDCPKPVVCGDMKDPSEECDDGENNVPETWTPEQRCMQEVCKYTDFCGDTTCQPEHEDATSCEADCMNPMPVCGNGKLEPGEVCDDGTTNNMGECVADCTMKATCGDSFVQTGVEECDDGNNVNEGACVEGCKLAFCGDSFVQTDVEDCDDGNEVNDDDCSNACESPRRVFVTSTSFQGNLGGLAGADTTCQMRADMAGLDGTFLAWLSDSAAGPASDGRFDKSFAGVYILVGGTPVTTNGWAGLTSGSLDVPIDRDENGVQRMNLLVWTNTKPDGTVLSPTKHCIDWSSPVNNKDTSPVSGDNNMANAEWTESTTVSCATMNSLYCFENP